LEEEKQKSRNKNYKNPKKKITKIQEQKLQNLEQTLQKI
jgi:hypothetical protein